MNENFTPDDAYVRTTYISAQGPEHRTGPEFDRWLAQHDAQVRQEFVDNLTRLGTYTLDIHTIRGMA